MTLIERSIWKVILWCCNLVVTSACTAAVIIIRCQGWRDWYHEAPWGSHEAFFISPRPGIYCLTSPGLGGRLCSDPIIASVMNRVSSEWSKIEHEAFDYWVYIAADEGCNGLCGSFKQVVIIFLCWYQYCTKRSIICDTGISWTRVRCRIVSSHFFTIPRVQAAACDSQARVSCSLGTLMRDFPHMRHQAADLVTAALCHARVIVKNKIWLTNAEQNPNQFHLESWTKY